MYWETATLSQPPSDFQRVRGARWALGLGKEVASEAVAEAVPRRAIGAIGGENEKAPSNSPERADSGSPSCYSQGLAVPCWNSGSPGRPCFNQAREQPQEENSQQLVVQGPLT